MVAIIDSNWNHNYCFYIKLMYAMICKEIPTESQASDFFCQFLVWYSDCCYCSFVQSLSLSFSPLVLIPCTQLTHSAGLSKPRTQTCDWPWWRLIRVGLHHWRCIITQMKYKRQWESATLNPFNKTCLNGSIKTISLECSEIMWSCDLSCSDRMELGQNTWWYCYFTAIISFKFIQKSATQC